MPIRTPRMGTAARGSARLAVLLVAASVLLGGTARARTDICYQGGLNLPNFKLNGAAKLNGTDLLVTPDLATQLGSAMFAPTFAATSDIHIQLQLQITTTVGGGGDGMAFVMHRDPRGAAALGDPGAALGYGGTAKITPSVVVELDTVQNVGDPNGNHIGVTLDGVESSHTALYTPPFTMKTAGAFYVWIDYTAVNTLLEVYVSQSATKPMTAQLATNVNVAQRFGNQPFYMGFTGSTGSSQSQHEILSFIASDTAATTAVCCQNNTDCAGNALGGVCDTVKHVCGQCTPTQLSACTMQKPGCDIGGASNTCIAGCTGNFGSGMSGACASASAPFCIPSGPTAGSCSACDGNSGSGKPFACATGAPSCNASGFCGLCTKNADCTATCTVATKVCAPCNGDAGSAATNACPDAANAPICDALGGCRKCINDNDCTTGTHAGPFCNTANGTCGAGCANDAQCGAGHWCSGGNGTSGGSCKPLLMNGEPLPGSMQCTTELAQRVCASQLCSGTNNQCVECTVNADCKTAGKSCTNFACVDGTPDSTMFSFAGGGFGFACNVSTAATGNAGALGFLASAGLLAALTLRRRRQGRL